MKYLSFVKEINCYCFNLPMRNCKDVCNYGTKSKVGYCMNSRDFRFNEAKRLNNEKLINSDKFERELLKEIDLTRHTHFRINSIGDFEYNQNGVIQLEKILNLAKKRPNLNFWITTHNDFILYSLFPKNKKLTLKNVSIQLSHPQINQEWDKESLKFWNAKKISCTSTTIFKTKSNCHKSINWTLENSSCGNCTECFKQNRNTIFNLHGTYAKSRYLRFKDNE